MLEIFPFLPWVALATSAALLAALGIAGDLGRVAPFLVAWFVLAAACQFFGDSAAVTATGLVLQTALALYLLIRWKAGS